MPLKRLQYLRKIQPKLIHEAEDCLYLNIYVPKGGKLLFTICTSLTFILYQMKGRKHAIPKHIDLLSSNTS